MYRLNEVDQAILGTLIDVADRHIAPASAKVDAEGKFPGDAVDALGDAGFLGLTVPLPFGGMGKGPRVAAALLEALAERCSSSAMVYLMHLCGVACYAAVPERTSDFLSAAARGRHLSTLAFSERGSRSHFWAPVSRAMRNNGRVSLPPEKSFVTSAGFADGYVVSTLDADAATPLASTLYLVLSSDRGVNPSTPTRGGARVAGIARTDDAAPRPRSQGGRHGGGCRRHGSRDARVRRRGAGARARSGTPVSRRPRADCDVAEHRSGARLYRPRALRHGGVLMIRSMVCAARMLRQG